MLTAEMLTGEMLIGARAVRGTEGTFRAVNPAKGAEIGAGVWWRLDRGCGCGMHAGRGCLRSLSRRQPGGAREVSGNDCTGNSGPGRCAGRAGDQRIGPAARTRGRRTRAHCGAASAVCVAGTRGPLAECDDGSRNARAQAVPRADLRSQKIPVGPVAVFSASNFPLAFSVAGGDTAAAFAAGCPVVAKSHSSHLGTSELVGRVVQKAVAECGLPEGVFSLLVGRELRSARRWSSIRRSRRSALPARGAWGGTWLRWPRRARSPSRCTRR